METGNVITKNRGQRCVTEFFVRKIKKEQSDDASSSASVSSQETSQSNDTEGEDVYLKSLDIEIQRIEDNESVVPDESSNSSYTVTEILSSSVLGCHNPECIELKSKYNKLKQAYAKSLTVNVLNIEKIQKYELEAEEREKLTEKVSCILFYVRDTFIVELTFH